MARVVGLVWFMGGSMAMAGPAPGTAIDNFATGTALDSISGTPLTAISDTVHAYIPVFEALTLVPERGAGLAPGAAFVFAHRLTNAGNSTADERLDLFNLAGDGFDLTSLALVRDVDGDGQPSPGDLPWPSGAAITLAPGEGADLLVTGSVPASAPASSLAWVRLTATTPAIPLAERGGPARAATVSVAVTDTARTLAAVLPPDLAFFRDASFGATTRVASAGQPLYVQALAPGCDLDPTRPDTVTITLRSQLTGDVESYRAVETAASSGAFRIMPPVVTARAISGNAVQNSGALEVVTNDQVTATLLGCGATTTQALVWIDPAGMVFDARSDLPVAAARVALVDVTGAGNGGDAGGPARVFAADGVTPAPSTVSSDASGRYAFASVPASTYRLDVTPPLSHRYPSLVPPGSLAAGHVVDAAGSYGVAFGQSDAGAPVRFDLPLDADGSVALFVDKTASPAFATVGDLVDYAVTVANRSDSTLTVVEVDDLLPPGFRYVSGSARRDTSALADPSGGAGPQLRFAIGALGANAQAVLRYRLRVGPASPLGESVNQAFAIGGGVQSNTARATVTLLGGEFAQEATVLGTVFVDHDGDGKRAVGEPGVPGVRVVADDGTFAITDGDGRFSFYGLSPRTHSMLLDRTTLPDGAAPFSARGRERRQPALKSVALQLGDLQRVDFAVRGGAGLDSIVAERRLSTVTLPDEGDRMVRRQLPLVDDPASLGDPKARPVSGVVGGNSGSLPLFGNGERERTTTTPNLTPTLPGTTTMASPEGPTSAVVIPTPGMPATSVAPSGASNSVPIAVALNGAGATWSDAAAAQALDQVLMASDRHVGFVGVSDGDTLPADQMTVRVKGQEGSNFELRVNGRAVPVEQVGRKLTSVSTGVEVWEWIGVALDPGHNVLFVSQRDAALVEQGQAVVQVVAPDRFARLELTLPKSVSADGHTLASVRVRALDGHGLPVSGRTLITLESSRGEWATADLDPRRSGLQIAIEDGAAEALLVAPSEPGPAKVRASTYEVSTDTTLNFVPELRPLLLVGSVEGRLDLATLLRGGAGARDRSLNSFEQTMREFSDTSADGKRTAAARAALYVKGRVRDDLLLTLGYDSDRPDATRLFRDIQPDAFYPVYGDASVHGYDAQSTGHLYARVDKPGAWLMYGDYTPITGGGARSLATYNRSLTGVQEHWDDGRVRVDAFTSREQSLTRVDELPGLGISGPYRLLHVPIRENSERVEIITRDRNQSEVVLGVETQTRFADYELDPLDGQLVFKQPVPSFDSQLNPVSVRVTYEERSGGEAAWVSGVEARVHVNPRLQVGGTYVDDHDPAQPYQLRAAFVGAKLGTGTTVEGEFATAAAPGEQAGDAGRIEIQHETPTSKGLFYAAVTDSEFANRSAGYGPGRAEAGLHWHTRLSERLMLRAEGLYTGDILGDARRAGLLVGLERGLNHAFRGEFGLRVAGEQLRAGGAEPTQFSLRGKLGAQWPRHPELSAYAEAEQDLREWDRQMGAIGGEYRFSTVGRLYLRHELISSLTGPFALSSRDRTMSTVFGIDSDVMRDAHVFSEYRLRDALSGREAEASIGLRHSWSPDGRYRISTSFERVNPLSKSDVGPTTAITGGIESLGDDDVKSSSRMEVRNTRGSQSFLWGMAAAWRLDSTWTTLARSLTNVTTDVANGTTSRERLQLGLSWRPSESARWAALGRYELHYDRGAIDTGLRARRIANVLSAHAAGPMFEVVDASVALAAKFVNLRDNLAVTRSDAQWVHGRLAHDLGDHWDIGVQASALFGGGGRRDGLGVEIGRDLGRGVWLSGGWNRFGYDDSDLPDEEYTHAGVYARIRARFDQSLIQRTAEGRP